ncbi:MAG: ribosomal RNA small subunit methyltransferase A [Candidatus Fischerbacteria bacterium RBG_13_37_8]|uniref:Ribosomal RNA small subunit methyltransferase A n=1 Tax=Candidatus Fischerbacteria bacterium RBG_13_37_8 TaxID=1817863 RepID=A0A1F5V4P4_9BACT|nr:MAG: ribosomal RNA small subunit methyltransferase A [Candidatus Fischerbacteria bacterium RBG_13_37_8]
MPWYSQESGTSSIDKTALFFAKGVPDIAITYCYSNMMNKRRLGQNFLISTRIARRIAQTAAIRAGDTVIEIGPGKGALTRHLLKTGARIIAVEIDPYLVQLLREKFASEQNLVIINDDILTQSISALTHQGNQTESVTKIIGNIPFSITSPLIEWLIHEKPFFHQALLMLQKEFAARLIASPHNKDYGKLSVIAELYFERKFSFDVKKNMFYPVPKVDATVIKLTVRDKLTIPVQNNAIPSFEEFLIHCFAHRRKTLLKSLQVSYGGKKSAALKNKLLGILTDLNIKTNIRAEQLTLAEFWTLFKHLDKQESL